MSPPRARPIRRQAERSDVAAEGSAPVPAARRSRQNPGGAVAQAMIALLQNAGAWPFPLLSILILIVMGSILEGAAAQEPGQIAHGRDSICALRQAGRPNA